MIRIERSREIFSAHFTNSKIQNGSNFLFKMRVKRTMKSLLICMSWLQEPFD